MSPQLWLGLPVALAVALTAAVLSTVAPTTDPAPHAGAPLSAAPADPASQAVARRALLLTAGVPRLGYRIRFGGARPGERGRIDRDRRVIEIFLRRGDPAHRVAHDVAHELGHAYDDRRLSDAGRVRYLRRRGAPHAAWWPRGARSDLATGAGDFAEVFARCHVPSPDFRSVLRPAPTDACAMLPPDARPR